MKKKSLYWKKKTGDTPKADKVWADAMGTEYRTRREAQVSTFLRFVRGGFVTGFPVVVGKWFWYSAIAVYPFVFIRKDQITVERLNHEKIHIRQILDLFVVGAYVWYAAELYIRLIGALIDIVKGRRPVKKIISWAYFSHSMEREARENEKDKDYLFKRKKFAFLKYL